MAALAPIGNWQPSRTQEARSADRSGCDATVRVQYGLPPANWNSHSQQAAHIIRIFRLQRWPQPETARRCGARKPVSKDDIPPAKYSDIRKKRLPAAQTFLIPADTAVIRLVVRDEHGGTERIRWRFACRCRLSSRKAQGAH